MPDKHANMPGMEKPPAKRKDGTPPAKPAKDPKAKSPGPKDGSSPRDADAPT